MCQTFQSWRAFIVDDSSTDNTTRIVNIFSKQDPRITLVHRNRSPKGAQTCRNIGFELSEGAEYVVFLDADDLIAPYCLEQRVLFMDAHQDLDFGVFLSKSFFNHPNEVRQCTLFGFRFEGLNDLKRLLRRTHPFVIWSNMYRRTALVRTGIRWDERILSLQDSDFNLQTFQKQLKYDYDDDCQIDYFYRTSVDTTHTFQKIGSAEHKESHLIFLDKLYNFLSERQRKECRLELDDYLLYFIEMLFNDKEFVTQLLNMDWIKSRYWFRLRVRLYCFLKKNNRCGKRVLFPLLNSFRQKFDIEYRDYQNQLLTEKPIPSTFIL